MTWDEITQISWKMWPALCIGCHTPRYVSCSYLSIEAKGAAWWLTTQKLEKTLKYLNLDYSHAFTSVTIESLGAVGTRTLAFFKELGFHLRQQLRVCPLPSTAMSASPKATSLYWGLAVIGARTHECLCQSIQKNESDEQSYQMA